MAVTTECKKISVAMKLNVGITSAGEVKTVSINLGSLNQNAFNAEKVLNIVESLSNCFDHMIYTTEKTEVSRLSWD